MVGGLEPLEIGLDALQAADVVFQVQMPTTGVLVLLAGIADFHGIEVRLLPKGLGQPLEPESHVEIFGGVDDPFGLAAEKVGIEVRGIHEARPVLAPAVVDPVGGDFLGHGLAVFFGHLILHPGVQLKIERHKLFAAGAAELEHFIRGHAVLGHLQAEVVTVAQLLGHAVSQVPQLHEARLQRHADLLAGFPGLAPGLQILALEEHVVKGVGGDGLARQLELESVHGAGLRGFCCDTIRHQLGVGHGAFGGVQQHAVQFAHGDEIQLGLVLQQILGFCDHRRIPREGRESLSSRFSRGIMYRADIGAGGPLGFAVHGI